MVSETNIGMHSKWACLWQSETHTSERGICMGRWREGEKWREEAQEKREQKEQVWTRLQHWFMNENLNIFSDSGAKIKWTLGQFYLFNWQVHEMSSKIINICMICHKPTGTNSIISLWKEHILFFNCNIKTPGFFTPFPMSIRRTWGYTRIQTQYFISTVLKLGDTLRIICREVKSHCQG